MAKGKRRQEKPNARAVESADTQISADAQFTLNDIQAGIVAETQRCVARAIDQAVVLQSVAAESINAVGEVQIRSSDQVMRGAHRLRAMASQGLLLLVQIEREAARLETLATIDQLVPKNDEVVD